MVKHGFYALLMSVLFVSCKKTEDDSFSFERTNYTSNNLRLDGYYYYHDLRAERYNILFLYKNGVVFYGTSVLQSEIEEMEHSYADGSYYKMAKDYMSSWRIFKVAGENIEIESRGSDGSTGLRVFKYSGYIINDTTFDITKIMSVNGDNVQDVNNTYHFKAFLPKPDSTNSFIP